MFRQPGPKGPPEEECNLLMRGCSTRAAELRLTYQTLKAQPNTTILERISAKRYTPYEASAVATYGLDA